MTAWCTTQAKVHGDKGAKVMAVWVVDKTKPLATPAK